MITFFALQVRKFWYNYAPQNFVYYSKRVRVYVREGEIYPTGPVWIKNLGLRPDS